MMKNADGILRVGDTRKAGGSVQVMAVNYGSSFDYADSHGVRVKLDGLGKGERRVSHWQVDRDHSNAYAVWLEMGRPVVPSDEQLAKIQERMELELVEPEFALEAEGAELKTEFAPQSASLWVLRKA